MLIKGLQSQGVAWALQKLPKLILLLIGLAYVPLLQAQSSGQWGICEFSTLSALNSFDPSSNNWDCKIAHCQADLKYYYWDGDSWEEMILHNLYTQDGSLSGSRTINLNGYDLNIDVANDASTQFQIDNNYLTIGRDPVGNNSTYISSRATLTFAVDNNNNSTSDNFVWGTNGTPDLGSNDPNFSQWMRLSNGSLRLSLYGSGSYTGTASQILGVDSDGDVIEVSASSLDTDTYLGANDQTLTTARSIDLNGNDLSIDVANDGTTQLIFDDDRLTIGRDAKDTNDAFISAKHDINFSVSNNNNSSTNRYRWGSDASPDLARNDPNYDEWMVLQATGLKLSKYGGGSITGTASQILGVDSDGDVIEISASSLDTYLGAFDQTLTGARRVNLDGNELTFTATTDIVMEPTGELGIGTADPNAPLHIYEATGTTPSGSDASLLLEHGNSGGTSSIVFKSASNINSDYGYISFSDDGSGNGSTDENGLLTIGIQNDVINSFQDDIAIMSSGYVGIGTTSPSAKLDLDGGTLKLSDYGTGSNTGTATYGLAVDADGDVIETNTTKSSQTFYPPAIAIDASSTGTGLTLDLHQEYVNRFGSPAVKSSSAPAAIPYYSESELYYYVTDYDTAVFANLSISDAGVLTYDIIASPADDYSLINVVFVVK